MVKNRFMSNLRGTVAAARKRAEDAYRAGRAKDKHRRVLTEYLDRLTSMRKWVVNHCDMVSLLSMPQFLALDPLVPWCTIYRRTPNLFALSLPCLSSFNALIE